MLPQQRRPDDSRRARAGDGTVAARSRPRQPCAGEGRLCDDARAGVVPAVSAPHTAFTISSRLIATLLLPGGSPAKRSTVMNEGSWMRGLAIAALAVVMAAVIWIGAYNAGAAQAVAEGGGHVHWGHGFG